ncbi:TR10B factor, partial [Caloenas nicobarica]|nr:TR10B factor [Caloenas nicobarica]
EFALGTAAAAVNRRDLSDPSRGGKDFYQVQDSDRYCKMCPAEHCEEPNGTSKCLPCNKSEYIEYPNAFHRCLGCQTCREDQVELSPCRADSNTQCACKPGTFCSPDHSCEMCQKCRPRCPQGEVELAPCTPHSDRQCGPPTGTSSSLSKDQIVIISLVVVAAFVILLFICCSYCRRRHSSGDGRDLSGKSCSVVLPCCQRGGLGTQDNIHNEQLFRDQLLGPNSGSVTPRTPELEEVMPRTSNPDVKPRRKLVPVQEEDPVSLLRRSFYVFAENVLWKDWKRYGRALDLMENEIAFAMNEPFTQEAFYQMLHTWHNKQGMNASVNTLLDTLHEINLSGTAEDIASKLVQKGLFQYEAS